MISQIYLLGYVTLALLFNVACFANNTQFINNSKVLLENHRPTGALTTLLERHHINSLKLPIIIQKTQKLWLRQPNQERWDLEKTTTKSLQSLFTDLGMTQACLPTQKHYNYAVLMGASVDRMQLRLQFLLEQCQNGLAFDQFVVLTGMRSLNDQEFDRIPKLGGNIQDIKTEADAIRYLLEWTPLPAAFRQIPWLIVEAPMIQGKRPNTASTALAWLANNPSPGSVIAISNQPYIGYQSTSLQTVLPKTFTVEVIGRQANENIPDSVYLDNLARWLFQYDRLQSVELN